MCFRECEKMLSQQNVCSTSMYSRDTRNRHNTKTNAYLSCISSVRCEVRRFWVISVMKYTCPSHYLTLLFDFIGTSSGKGIFTFQLRFHCFQPFTVRWYGQKRQACSENLAYKNIATEEVKISRPATYAMFFFCF